MAGSSPLAWFLRCLALLDLLALGVVLLPIEWIDKLHQAIGGESLVHSPLTGYLVQATSALYALHGALLLFLSFDVNRYLPLIRFLGWLAIGHGAILLLIDVRLGMPVWWCAMEGPVFVLCGVGVLGLSPPVRGLY